MLAFLLFKARICVHVLTIGQTMTIVLNTVHDAVGTPATWPEIRGAGVRVLQHLIVFCRVFHWTDRHAALGHALPLGLAGKPEGEPANPVGVPLTLEDGPQDLDAGAIRLLVGAPHCEKMQVIEYCMFGLPFGQRPPYSITVLADVVFSSGLTESLHT